jgi:hypothetical protein
MGTIRGKGQKIEIYEVISKPFGGLRLRQSRTELPTPGIAGFAPAAVRVVLLRLVLVEQRHDLPHHDVHGIITHFLRDRDELDAVLRELADVELKLEVVAGDAREAVDDDYIERRGLARRGLDHPLELRAAVIGGGCARLRRKVVCPAGQAFVYDFPVGLTFATGIGYAFTKLVADADTTVLVAADITAFNLDYV